MFADINLQMKYLQKQVEMLK